MALEIKQSIRMSQQLVVTPQLQQAIRLLQLSRIELTTLIQKELTENPCLEEDEEESQTVRIDAQEESHGDQHAKAKEEDKGHEHLVDEVGPKDGEFKEPANFDWESYIGTYNAPGPSVAPSGGDDLPTYENTIKQGKTLQDHLLWQLGLSPLKDLDAQIAEEIIGNINDDGYLQSSTQEIAEKLKTPREHVDAILSCIQELDPLGVGARNVKECLLLQCTGFGGEEGVLITQVIEHHLSELEKHNYKKIGKSLGVPTDRVLEIESVIRQLDPKPGRAYSSSNPQYITPDVFIHKRGDEYIVTLNEDGLPKLSVSPLYRRAILAGESVGNQTKDYIQDKLRQALWLIKSIHQRQRTLYRVAKSIVKFQRDFFEKGVTCLRPMVLKDVAEDINMHESTISRVTANKYAHTSRGLFELKYFFNSSLGSTEEGGVASEVVKNHIQNLIAAESQKKPLSDQEISRILKEKEGVDIARRTVAKYREMLRILPSSRRRRKL